MIGFFKCLPCDVTFQITGPHSFAIKTPICTSCEQLATVWDVESEFKTLVEQWENETNYLSSVSEMMENIHFQRIIHLAEWTTVNYVSHLILEEIHQKPSLLFHALHVITKENPLTNEMDGQITIQCRTWVDWGKRKGWIWIPAKKGDIIEVISGPYVTQYKVGERFIVLGVFSGDDTAIVMEQNGEVGTLCFPEEYIVVDDMEHLLEKWEKKTFGKSISNHSNT